MANWITKFLNLIIKALGSLLGVVCSFLPDSPFQMIENSPIMEHLSTLNYFIPISEMIVISEAWLGCILIYYAYQTVLRWIKAIQ